MRHKMTSFLILPILSVGIIFPAISLHKEEPTRLCAARPSVPANNASSETLIVSRTYVRQHIATMPENVLENGSIVRNNRAQLRIFIRSLEPFATHLSAPYNTAVMLKALRDNIQVTNAGSFEGAQKIVPALFDKLDGATRTRVADQFVADLEKDLQIDTRFLKGYPVAPATAPAASSSAQVVTMTAVTTTVSARQPLPASIPPRSSIPLAGASSFSGAAAASRPSYTYADTLKRDLQFEQEARKRAEERAQAAERKMIAEITRPRLVRTPTSEYDQQRLRNPSNPFGLPQFLSDIDERTPAMRERAEYLTRKALEAIHYARPADEYGDQLLIHNEDYLRRGGDFSAGELARVKADIINVMSRASKHQRQDFQEHYQESLQNLKLADTIPSVIQTIRDAQHINTHRALMDGLEIVRTEISERTRTALEARLYPMDYNFGDARAELTRIFNQLPIKEKVVCAYWYDLKLKYYLRQNQDLPAPTTQPSMHTDVA